MSVTLPSAARISWLSEAQLPGPVDRVVPMNVAVRLPEGCAGAPEPPAHAPTARMAATATVPVARERIAKNVLDAGAALSKSCRDRW